MSFAYQNGNITDGGKQRTLIRIDCDLRKWKINTGKAKYNFTVNKIRQVS